MKNEMENNLLNAIIDEIALEGLDGITLETLWVRLETRKPSLNLTINTSFKQWVWNGIRSCEDLKFYLLETPRRALIYVDRFAYLEPETGVVIEQEQDDIYPLTYSKNPSGIRGSCSAPRSDISHVLHKKNDDADGTIEMKYEDVVASFGNKLLLVASQELRYKVLYSHNMLHSDAVNIISDDKLYCLMERIGRCRWNGMTTVGVHENMQTVLKTKPTNSFSMRKNLKRYNLITVQFFCVRPLKATACITGKLVLLRRFHADHTPSYICQLKHLCHILAEPPNQGTMLLTDVKKKMNISDELFRKVHKLGSKNVKIETREYRHVHPHATPEDYLTKSKVERRLKVVRLMSPFKMEEDVLKKEEEELDDDLEEDDNNASCGFTLVRNDVKTASFINETMLNKCYRLVSESGFKGMRLGELLSGTGLSLGEMRVLWRNLTYRDCFDVIKVEVGKLRVQKLFIRDDHRELQHNIILPEQSFCTDKSPSKDETPKQQTEEPSTIFNITNESARTTSSPTSQEKETDVCVVGSSEMLDQTYHSLPPQRDLSLKKCTDEFEGIHCDEPDELQYVKVFNKNNLTQRNLHRAHTIMNILATHSVVHDTAFFKQEVHKEEGTKLLTLKILKRLLNSLSQRGFLKVVHRREEINGNVEKDMVFYCLPGVSEDSEEFRRALQQRKAKERMILSATYRASNACKDEIKVTASNRMPKFEKARNIHVFLWGLLRKEEGAEVAYDWLPYVSPLPKLHDHPDGWLNMNDVLENMPLSLLTTAVLSCSLQEDIGLSKHTSFKHLPPQLMNKLSTKRRHLFKFESVCELLVKLGLLTFEKSDALRKEEMHMYVHKRGSLVDESYVQHTNHFSSSLTTRPDGTILFQFNTMKDIEAYWDILKFICLASNNEAPTLPSKLSKKKFNELLLSKEVGSVYDDGELPGDGQGPAGIDSSLFGTLKRNWLSVEALSSPRKEFVENNVLRASLVKRGPSVGCKQLKKRSNVRKTQENDNNNDMASEESKATIKSIKKSTKNNKSLNEEELKKQKKREEMSKEKKRLRKLNCYDVKDEEAKKNMTSQRVTWSVEEDKVILLCTLTNVFLSGKLKWMLHTSAIRDFLHEAVPSSKTKTSAACMRRKNFQMRKESVSNMLSVQLASLLHHKKLCKRFKTGKENAARNQEVFRECLHAINLILKIIPEHHFVSNDGLVDEGDTEVLQLPSSISAIKQQYNICRPSVSPHTYFKHPTTTQQINFYALQNVMHSVGLLSDKIGRSHELLQLINDTSSSTLYSVIKSLVDFGVFNRLKKPDAALTPSVLGSYQIAHRYQFIWSNIYPKSICTKWHSFLGIDGLKDASEEGDSNDDSHYSSDQTKVVASKSSSLCCDDGYVRLTNSSECASLITCMLVFQSDMVIETTVPKEIVVVEMPSKTQSNKHQTAKDDEKNYSSDMNDLEDEDEDDEEFGQGSNSKILTTEAPQASTVHSRTFLYWYRSQYAHAKTLRYSEASNSLFVNACNIRVQVPVSFKGVEAINGRRSSKCVHSVYALERVRSYNHRHNHLHPFSFRVLLKNLLLTVPHHLDVPQTLQTCLQVLSHHCEEDVVKLHDYVHASTHLGVTMTQLKEKLPHLSFRVIKHILCVMTSLSLVVRVGLLDVRWVCFDHAHSWVVSVKRNMKGRGVFNTDKFQFNFEDFDIESTIRNPSTNNAVFFDEGPEQQAPFVANNNVPINPININGVTTNNIDNDKDNNEQAEAKVVFKSGGCVMKSFNDFSFSKPPHNKPSQPSSTTSQSSFRTSFPHTSVITQPHNPTTLNTLPSNFADPNNFYDNEYMRKSTKDIPKGVPQHYNYHDLNLLEDKLNSRKRKLDEIEGTTNLKLWKRSEGNEVNELVHQVNNKTCDNFRLRSLKLLEMPSQNPCTSPAPNTPSFPSITPSFSNQLTPLSNHTMPTNPCEPSPLSCPPPLDPVSTISNPFLPDHNFYMDNNINSGEFSSNSLKQFDGACDDDESSSIESSQKQKPSPKKRKIKRKDKLEQDATATGTYKTLRIVPRPWKTPEGTLNRKMLSTMLQSILLHVMQNPGINQDKLTSKYQPTLQPIVVLELVEVLENLGTVKITYASSLSKPILFSSAPFYQSADKVVATLMADICCFSKISPFLLQLLKNKPS